MDETNTDIPNTILTPVDTPVVTEPVKRRQPRFKSKITLHGTSPHTFTYTKP